MQEELQAAGAISADARRSLGGARGLAFLVAALLSALLALLAGCGENWTPFVSDPDAVEAQGGAGGAGGGRIRAVTYNIHVGKGMDGRIDLGRIAGVLTMDGMPDVAGLQEVDRNVTRTGNVDQFERLEALSGMKGVFGKSIDLQGGEYGIAILTSGEILESRHVLHPVGEESERRSMLIARIRSKNGVEFWAINTHLGLVAGDRAAQVRAMMDAAAALNGPVLLMGDFNNEPSKEEDSPYRVLDKQYIDCWKSARESEMRPDAGYPNFANYEGATFRSDFPDKRIDFIWARRGDGWRARQAWTRGSLASDHLPLFAEISYSPSAKTN